MDIVVHDVGLCTGCPRMKPSDKPACFSINFNRIGTSCATCVHNTDALVCQTCVRDHRILRRRDLHGDEANDSFCGTCQRDIRLLQRTDRYEKGISKVAKDMLEQVDKEIGKKSPIEAANEWMRGD